MHLFCNSRWVYFDQDCLLYQKLNCATKRWHETGNYQKCRKISIYKQYMQSTRGECVEIAFPYFNKFSLGNFIHREWKGSNMWLWHLYNYLTMIFFWIMVQIWSVYYRHKVEDYGKTSFTPKSFTVMIKGLPRFKDQPNYNMRELIKQSAEAEGFKVEQVSCVYDTIAYTRKRHHLKNQQVKLAKELYKFKENLLGELYEKEKDKVKGEKLIKKIADKIEDDEFELDKMECDFDGKLTKKFTGQAFISFRNKSEKSKFYIKHKKYGICWRACECLGKTKEPFKLKNFPFEYKAYALKAPEPNDIYWDALCYKTRGRRWYAALAWTLGIIVSAIAFCAVLGLYILASNFQTELSRNKADKDLGAFFTSENWFLLNVKRMAPALFIVVINEMAASIIE